MRAATPTVPTPGADHWPTGAGLTTTDAMTLTEVYRAVSIISNAVGQLTLDVERNGKAVKTQPLWFTKPDAKFSRSAFLQMTATSLALNGNAFWRVIRVNQTDPTSAITALVVENPNTTYANTDVYGNVVSWRVAGIERELRPFEVEHIKLLHVPGTYRGLGPIQAAREDLFGAIEARTYGTRFFDTSGVPNGVLKTEQILPQGKAGEYKDQWDSSNGRGVRVLDRDFSYSPLYINPRDAQFLESRNFSSVQIARLFGVPARLMLLEAGSEDYANVAQADQQFIRWSLSGYLRPIEEAFSNLLSFQPRPASARFNLDGFLRSTTNERYEAHKTAIEAGFLTVDEVRALEGRDPLPQAPAPAAQNAAPETPETD